MYKFEVRLAVAEKFGAAFNSGTSDSFIMAYIPPHKRRSNEMERPLPTPELLAPQFKKILNMKPSRSNVEHASYSYIYAKHSISRWCTIGLDDENQFPSSIDLEPVSMESTE